MIEDRLVAIAWPQFCSWHGTAKYAHDRRGMLSQPERLGSLVHHAQQQSRQEASTMQTTPTASMRRVREDPCRRARDAVCLVKVRLQPDYRFWTSGCSQTTVFGRLAAARLPFLDIRLQPDYCFLTDSIVTGIAQQPDTSLWLLQ